MTEKIAKTGLSKILARLALSRDDTDAWKLLYLRMWPFVISLNFRLLGGVRHAAEDASQEVFLRLLQYSTFEALQEPDAFYRYLRAVCTNVVKDYRQGLTKRGEIELTPEQVELLKSNLPRVEGAELSDIYEHMFSRLNNADRQLIEFAVVGYTIQEIADATGLSYNNAAVRIHRIRKRLRKMFLRFKSPRE